MTKRTSSPLPPTSSERKNAPAEKSVLGDLKEMIGMRLGRIPTAMVFILGIALFLSVLTGAVLKFATPSESAQKEFLPLRLTPTVEAPMATEDSLDGVWVTQGDGYAMTLTVEGNKFEWMVALTELGENPFYARGNYKITGDVMVLGQRPDMGVPYNAEKPWLRPIPIAMTNINVRLSGESGNMLWIVPPSEQSRIISHVAGIFASVQNDDGARDMTFVWKRRAGSGR